MSATGGHYAGRPSPSRPEPNDVRVRLIALVAVFGALVALGIAWSAVHGPWSGDPVPFLWPVFPFGVFSAILVVFVLFRPFGWWGCWRPYWHDNSTSAREIVRTRFARGEIDADQMRRLLRDLEES